MTCTSRFFSGGAVIGLLCLLAPLSASALAAGSSPAIDSRSAEADGVELHYLTAGQGPALILLHGYAETSRMWRPIIPLLAGRPR